MNSVSFSPAAALLLVLAFTSAQALPTAGQRSRRRRADQALGAVSAGERRAARALRRTAGVG
jgi:hypothetical protein